MTPIEPALKRHACVKYDDACIVCHLLQAREIISQLRSVERNDDAQAQVLASLRKQVDDLERQLQQPIPMRLHCPSCHKLHVDEGVFAEITHECQSCGMRWAPADVPTVGVRFLSKVEP